MQLAVVNYSITIFQRTLQVLNVSGNGLDSIRELACLSFLSQFMATDNCLNDLKELAHVLPAWRYLKRLELIGNPLCHKSKYRDRVIIMAPALGRYKIVYMSHLCHHM